MEDKRGVRDRLYFAQKRLDDLKNLEGKYGGFLHSAQELERQQPVQEFFDHLVGAIEFLAQTINEHRGMGNHEEDVTARAICDQLPSGDPAKGIICQLHPKTKNMPLPSDPYSDEGSHFRIILFRNRVTHHGRNPFNFIIGGGASCNLDLDPREDQKKIGASKRPIVEELTIFWKLVSDKCEQVLKMT